MENMFYANNVNVGLSQDDITLDFLYINPGNANNSNDEKTVLKNRVILSPTQAKKMQAIFNNCITTYEKIYGTINLTPNLNELEKMGIKISQKNKKE